MIKRPKEIYFAILVDAEGRPLVNFKGYAEALEKYCDYVETLVNVLKEMINLIKETK